jgi:hypothetical protein
MPRVFDVLDDFDTTGIFKRVWKLSGKRLHNINCVKWDFRRRPFGIVDIDSSDMKAVIVQSFSESSCARADVDDAAAGRKMLVRLRNRVVVKAIAGMD